MSKVHNLIERLNKSSECFEELYYFFIMHHVEKRRAMLVGWCLDNFYGFYASLQTFNFLIIIIIKKKETKQFTRLSHQPSKNFPKRRVKETAQYFGFDLDTLAHTGISLWGIERKLSRVSRKFWEIMHWAKILHSEKQNQISRSNFVLLFLEPSLTVVAVVVKTFTYVLYLL